MRALSMTLVHGVPALMQDDKPLLTGLQAGIMVSRTAIEAAEGCMVEAVCAERGWYTAVQTGDTLECKVRIRK